MCESIKNHLGILSIHVVARYFLHAGSTCWDTFGLGSLMQWTRCYGEIETHRSDKVEIEVTRLFNSTFTVSRNELHEGAIKYVPTSPARQG
jgi:hypothetical protein